MNRIKPIDGLRTIAVLGVIWIHIWSFFGNISLQVGPVNIYRVIAIVGNGVDLFFVISGFCMYLMYSKKYPVFTVKGYAKFVWGRWKRIAPAFYAAVLFYFLLRFNELLPDAGAILAAHFLFVHTVWDVTELAAPFWSLATEWHFYMVLPFLFFIGSTKMRFNMAFWFLMIASMVFRFWLFGVHQQAIDDLSLTDRIYVRFIEFGWGILACRYYLSERVLPKWLHGWIGFVVGLIVAYAGRLLMTTEIISLVGPYGFIIKSFAEPIMTLGFAFLILNVIRSESIFSRMLNLYFFQFIGKISYSMYLWHWLVAYVVSEFVSQNLGFSNQTLILSFAITTLILIPISMFSYLVFERFYFKKNEVAINKIKSK